MAPASLNNLPEELLLKIVSFVDFVSLPSFAATNHRVLRCSQHLLERHSRWHQEYRVIHDRLPLTVPDLLQLALNGADDAIWHLRRVEFWGARTSWTSWKPMDDIQDERDSSDDDDPGFNHVDLFGRGSDSVAIEKRDFSEPEMESIEGLMREQLRFTDGDISLWRERLLDGWDEPLKGLLIALAPRVATGIFIAYPQESGDHHDKHPFDFICQAITRITASPNPAWPVGFQSLRKISVCSPTALRHPHDMYYAAPAEIAPLFKLPNLRILVLCLLGYDDDALPVDLEPASSSVEELKFYCCEISSQARHAMIASARNLRWLELDAISMETLTFLAHSHVRHSLEALHGPIQAVGERERGTDIGKLLVEFPVLRNIDRLYLDEMMTRADGPVKGRDTIQVNYISSCEGEECQEDRTYVIPNLNEVLPPSIETVTLQIHPGAWRGPLWRASFCNDPRSASLLLQNVARLAEDPRFTNLKEVCLFHITGIPSVIRHLDRNTPQFTWDEDAYDRIVAKGIDVHRRAETAPRSRYDEYETFAAHRDMHADPRTIEDRHETDPRLEGRNPIGLDGFPPAW